MVPITIKFRLFLCALLIPGLLRGQTIEILNNGESKYVISFEPTNNPYCQQAALEMQNYLQKIGAIILPINNTLAEYSIVIGTSNTIHSQFPNIPVSNLGEDGFMIKTWGTNLLIIGGSGKGPIYGVYTFLEKYLGCRMYAPGVIAIPTKRTISIPEINDIEIPQLILRDVFYAPALDSTYCNWNKINHAQIGSDASWGNWASTSFQLMPPSMYFNQHPEYYSLVNNKRVPDQLDYTNPGVYHALLGNLNAKIKHEPQYQYWSVSQEDNTNYCQCDNCEKVYTETGSPAGTIIEFVNKIAQFFPNKTISTLAYTYSRQPPVNINLAPNLNIMFCAIAKSYVTDYATSPYDSSMREDFSGWQKLTHNIFVWDYLINFNALESIYPNLLKLKPNLDYFVDKGVKGYFADGDYYSGGEFAELRSYLLAKLLWNPYADDRFIIQDFLGGFYGKRAAPFLWQYIQLIDQQLTGGPDKLTPDEAAVYYHLFQEAESSSADQSVFLQRVQKEQMGLDYSVIQMYLRLAQKDPFGFFQNNEKYDAFNDAVNRFLNELVQNKTTRLIFAEHNQPLYQFIVQWRNEMNSLRNK
jgi:Domain of unknown function (DUF4838)/Glycosyl hydrolase family 67 N-terminus